MVDKIKTIFRNDEEVDNTKQALFNYIAWGKMVFSDIPFQEEFVKEMNKIFKLLDVTKSEFND